MARIYLAAGILYIVSWNSEVQASAITAQNKINDLVENILGYSYLQNHYDDFTFYETPLDGSRRINEIANDFGQKFLDRNNAVKNLKNAVERSISSTSHVSECCRMNAGSFEMDNRFKQPIGSESCQRISSVASSPASYLNRNFETACAENLASMPWLRWQYFASETGVTTLYPAVVFDDCGSYDGRFRPFYVQTNVPEPKDIVVVLDKSGSMNNNHRGQTLMAIAKNAAKTVLSTLNPQDRVAVFGFSSGVNVMGTTNEKERCFQDQLAEATQDNIKAMTDFIDQIRSGGSTIYASALDTAFDYFERSENAERKAEKVILFLSDGEPTDPGSGYSILNVIKTRNELLNNSVILMTYGLGTENDYSILQHMAAQDGSSYGVTNEHPESIKAGLFTNVGDPTNLRKEMASYYTFFSERADAVTEPLWSLPYLDAWGLGMMMSATLPVHDNNNRILGVVGTDITMEDLLSGATYFRASPSSYIFIIESTGLVVFHPLFKYSDDHEVRSTHISAYETDSGMKKVIKDMMRGGSGGGSFLTRRILPEGATVFYGVRNASVMSDVYWTQISRTPFSICLVLAQDDKDVALQQVQRPQDAKFLYHRLDLVPPDNSFWHNDNYAARDQSAVSLGPRAFVNSDDYIGREERKEDVTSIVNYMLSGTGGSGFKPGVRDSVWASYEAENFWKRSSDSNLEKYIMWRYIGTKEGFIRIFPGTRMPKKFDSVTRPWYRNAVANRGKAAFSAPYKDAASGELIITVSKAIFEGRKTENHNFLTDEVIAVLGADIMLPYVRSLLQELYPDCTASDRYRCALIDSAGFVIIGHDESQQKAAADIPLHITQAEPFVAESLILNGIMSHEECLLVEEVKLLRTYRIVQTGAFSGISRDNCFNFQLTPIPLTNVFVISREIPNYNCERNSPCTCSSFSSKKSRTCVSNQAGCECPCSADYMDHNTCKNTFNFTGKVYPPKPCAVQSESTFDDVEKNTNTGTTDTTDTTDTSSPNLGGIIGGAVAAFVAILVVIVIAIMIAKKKKKPRETPESIYETPAQVGRKEECGATKGPLPSAPPPYEANDHVNRVQANHYGYPVQTNHYGNPVQTNHYGNPVQPNTWM